MTNNKSLYEIHLFCSCIVFLATLYNFCNINSFIGLLSFKTHTSIPILYTLPLLLPFLFYLLADFPFFVIFFPKFSNSFSFKKAFLYFISLNANCDSEANLCHWLFSKLLPSLPYFIPLFSIKRKKRE